jgi:hypothetical protein
MVVIDVALTCTAPAADGDQLIRPPTGQMIIFLEAVAVP